MKIGKNFFNRLNTRMLTQSPPKKDKRNEVSRQVLPVGVAKVERQGTLNQVCEEGLHSTSTTPYRHRGL